MNKTRQALRHLAEIIFLGVLLVALAVGIGLLLGGRQQHVGNPPVTQTEAYPPPWDVPTQPLTYPLPWELTPAPTWEPTLTYVPTETQPPSPTLIPTPVVTPIPLAEAPIIPLPAGAELQPFTLLYRQGNSLRIYRSDGAQDGALLDVGESTGLYLNDFGKWAAAAPDGKRVALVLCTRYAPYQAGDKPWPSWDLYLYDLESQELKLLIEGGTEPAWSPDGARLAYRGEDRSLWVMDLSTGESWQVYKVQPLDNRVMSIDWSPDGRQLVFVDQFEITDEIMVTDVEGNGSARVLLPGYGEYGKEFPHWSPDGKIIFFVSGLGISSSSESFANLWVVNVDGTKPLQLTKDIWINQQPQWSPNGQWILYSGSIGYEDEEYSNNLWVVDELGTGVRRLTNYKGNDIAPAWSREGGRVFFMRQQDVGIWMISLWDGSEINIPIDTDGFIVLP